MKVAFSVDFEEDFKSSEVAGNNRQHPVPKFGKISTELGLRDFFMSEVVEVFCVSGGSIVCDCDEDEMCILCADSEEIEEFESAESMSLESSDD